MKHTEIEADTTQIIIGLQRTCYQVILIYLHLHTALLDMKGFIGTNSYKCKPLKFSFSVMQDYV